MKVATKYASGRCAQAEKKNGVGRVGGIVNEQVDDTAISRPRGELSEGF
jgi:hypothetical protein